MYDLNLMRSANVPVISAGVMMANLSWKNANNTSGIVGASDQGFPSSTPLNMKNVVGSPMKPPMESPKARLNPTTIQRMLMTPIAIKLWSIVEIIFFVSIMPP
jgi:hypothetical protein